MADSLQPHPRSRYLLLRSLISQDFRVSAAPKHHVPALASLLQVGPQLKDGTQLPEMPGRDFPGTVTPIADALEPGTRMLLTEIDVPNPDHALSPGVYCTVFLIVPSEAIVFNRDWSQRRGGREWDRAHPCRQCGARRRHDREVSGGAAGSSKQLFEIELCHLLQVIDK